MRDLRRLADCRKRLNQCPLGSGAVAGTILPLDRAGIAKALEFDAPTANSIDATSDRDFAIEFVQALSSVALHLSRWAEESILFATTEFGFVKLPEAFSTGSSAMPQKKNPDALELIRGKCGESLCRRDCLVRDGERASAGLQQGHAGDAAAGLCRRSTGIAAWCRWRQDSWRA